MQSKRGTLLWLHGCKNILCAQMHKLKIQILFSLGEQEAFVLETCDTLAASASIWMWLCLELCSIMLLLRYFRMVTWPACGSYIKLYRCYINAWLILIPGNMGYIVLRFYQRYSSKGGCGHSPSMWQCRENVPFPLCKQRRLLMLFVHYKYPFCGSFPCFVA